MPSPLVGRVTEAIASRTAASITASSLSSASARWVKEDQTRFCPVGVGPMIPRAVGEEPMRRWMALVSSSYTCGLSSPRMRTSVGPRSSGMPIVQNHQLPVGMICTP
jgi:hypothetical protein